MTRAEYRSALKGRRCFVGMDLSSTKDLTALVAVFPDEDGFDVLAQFFCPEDSIRERSHRDRVPYAQWVKDEFLIATPGPSVDLQYVRRGLLDWAAEFQIRSVAFDPWNAHDLVNQLEKQDGFTCVSIRQGFPSLSSPTKSLETAILSKTLRHDGHPILRWCFSNTVVEMDAAGNIKPSKDKSTEKIDGVSALVNAIDQMDRNNVVSAPPFLMVLGAR